MRRVREIIGQILYASPARSLVWSEPRFVIVGTGRSGTGFISQLLSAGGIRTGHEGWWKPTGRPQRRLVGDASWCATFELDDYKGRIFHQIRDPLATLRSVAAVEVAPHRRDNAWNEFRTRFVDYTGDTIVDSLLTVDTWLTKAEDVAEWTWRLEDVTPDLVVEIGKRIGRGVDRQAVSRAMESATFNEKTKSKWKTYEFGWDDLPNGPEKMRVLAIAASYGYV